MFIPVIVWRILTPEERRRLVDHLFTKGGETPMKKKKAVSKLKLAKTAKAKKALKSTKK
jgi:hypothetical protein